MNALTDEQVSSCSSDVDICTASPNSSLHQRPDMTTSTPQQIYKPRVNFRSIESLAISSLNTSSLTPTSSPFPLHRHDDTGYSSFNSSALLFDHNNNSKENVHPSPTVTTNERKVRRKLSDWQIWHLRQAYSANRYPSPFEQEKLALQLLLPLSSVRIWFQNYRARSGRK